MHSHKNTQSFRAFTLIELLVVISIISILIAILLPALGKAKQSAMAIKCATQIKQLGIGFTLYSLDFKEWLPPNTIKSTQWAGQSTINGSIGYTYAWWQGLYYHKYIPSAAMYSDPVSNYQFAYNSDNIENTNVSYGLSGYGEGGDSSLIRTGNLIKPSVSIGLIENTIDAGFRTTVPLRRTYSYNRPDSAGNYELLGYYAPHSGNFNMQLYDGHVERISPQALTEQAPSVSTTADLKKYISSYHVKENGSFFFVKPDGYRP